MTATPKLFWDYSYSYLQLHFFLLSQIQIKFTKH